MAPPVSPPTNAELADLFEEIGDLLEIQGENPFKVRAYRRAAEVLRELPQPAAALDPAELRFIPGIGEAIAAKIVERVSTGSLAFLDRLHQQIPPSVRELVRVPGIGPKTAARLLKNGIVSRQGLEAALADGRLARLLGPTLSERIARGLLAAEPQSSRADLLRATEGAALARLRVERLPGVQRVEVAGSLRRFAERVGDVNLAASATDPQQAAAALHATVAGAERVEPEEVRFPADGLTVAVRFAPPAAFGSLWQWWTGSRAHNEALRERAGQRGLSLGRYGIAPPEAVGFATEEALYHALGLAWIPPELREARGEIERAACGQLPTLVTVEALRGDLHVHTDWSDGVASLEAMVAAAAARGYEYLAITDHSAGRAVARGLDRERLMAQIQRVRHYNETHPDGPLVLVGAEVDIRADGTLDYPDDLLRQLDVVVASVHSALDQPREKMTARLVAAARHPLVTLLGHPTGRLIGRRDPVAVDLEAVLAACAANGTWVEINAHPARLDLNDEHARLAREMGVRLVINCDAHAPDHFGLARYGVAVARRAWLGPQEIVNTAPRALFLRHLEERRR
ncbi:MAG: DNA polymerase/3'-5' exonuclease PolX [Chloroflexi bacterium]|nr:DNA polymerase/3'-5' exonuclease PolX [Chloroflexota bacterium]GIW09357.1 MAG: DNA polymerase/3'-5' exonuclease PolX [Dehalococcoidia bacterium]